MAQFAKGSTFAYSNDGGTTKSTVLSCPEIGLPEVGHEDLDITAHSDGDEFDRFMAGKGTVSDVSITVQYSESDTAHAGLVTLAMSGASAKFYLTPVVGKQWVVDGFISSFAPDAPVDGVYTAEVTLKVSGKPVLQTVPED